MGESELCGVGCCIVGDPKALIGCCLRSVFAVPPMDAFNDTISCLISNICLSISACL